MMKLRWGICCAGNISNDFVIALSTLPVEDHSVVAIAARSEDKAKAFAKKHGIPVAYGDYEALAHDENVDIVYIGALNHVHLPLCKLFLGNSKNVLCEKPLGLNKREVQQMIDVAKEKNVFLMEGWWTRFFPVSVKLREILAQGLIGGIKTMNASLGFPMTSIDTVTSKEVCGGALFSIGLYPIQEALMVFDQPPLSSSTVGFLTASDVDETSVTTLVFPNKAVATLTTSIAVELPNEAEIRGTRGYIKVHSPFCCPTKLEVTSVIGGEEANLLSSDLKTEIFEFPLPNVEKRTCFINSAGLRYEAECVRQCLMKGLKECPTVPLRDSLLVAEILDKARHDIGYVLDADL